VRGTAKARLTQQSQWHGDCANHHQSVTNKQGGLRKPKEPTCKRTINQHSASAWRSLMTCKEWCWVPRASIPWWHQNKELDVESSKLSEDWLTSENINYLILCKWS
jgi:hypothetical protein